MKLSLKITILSLLLTLRVSSQTAIPIPATLSGSNINLNIHNDVVQFLPGTTTQTIGFNQNPYLGPTLILDKNQEVNITVTNQLGVKSTVHWHGLHVAPTNDGGPHTAISAGGSWNPKFTVLDNASTYWYHPHFHGSTAEQVIKGAAGMIIVKDKDEAALNLPRTYGVDDFPIIVQTAQFNASNQFMPLGMQDSLTIVNGVRSNYGKSAYLNVPSQIVRLRLLNAAGERSFNFGFTNNKSFKIIGSDGGLLNNPVEATRIRISPGERYEILVDFSGMNNKSINLMSYASELEMGIQGGPTMPMPAGSPPMDSPINGVDFNIFELKIGAQTSNPITSIPNSLVTVTPIPASQSNVTRTINMTADDPMSMDGPFYLNGKSFDMDVIDYTIPINNTEIWQVSNQTMVAHPFHLHDVQFYVLDRDGNLPPVHERGRKDDILILPNETVSFITKFDTFSDEMVPYMFHCHILMHEDAGMMAQFLVVPSNLSTGSENMILTTNVEVYPNPTSKCLNIQMPEPQTVFDLKIIDASGKVIYSELEKNNNTVNVEQLSNGIYHIIVRTNSNFYSSKFIKN